jgi:hypothetical protein
MEGKMKKIKVLVLVGLIFIYYHQVLIANQSDSGIFMSVSGRVVQKETNSGVANVRVAIYNAFQQKFRFEALTDKTGNFQITEIPDGKYSVSVHSIQKSCPENLVVDESSTLEINVVPGKNIRGVSIYLRNGESVSGVILGPDGKTPLLNASVSVVPYQIGKKLDKKVDVNGRFSILGINAKSEKSNFCLVVMSPGFTNNYKLIQKPPYFANTHEIIQLKKGDNINNLSIIMGKGNISVKGKILSADNLPIQGAIVSISSISRLSSELNDGDCISDGNGDFRIIGFKNAVDVEISAFHEIYGSYETQKKLISGENTIDIKLVIKKKLNTDILLQNKAQLSSSSQSNDADYNDCCQSEKDKFNAYLDLLCIQTNTDKGMACVNNSETYDCIKYKCENRSLITVNCKDDCKNQQDEMGNIPCAYVLETNLGNSEISSIFYCRNNCNRAELDAVLFHEIFHTCDSESTRYKDYEDPCDEKRASQAASCIFNDQVNKDYFNYFKKQCFTVEGKI